MTRFEKIIERLDCRLAVYRGSDSMGTNLSATARTVVRHVLGVPNFLHRRFGPMILDAGLLSPVLGRPQAGFGWDKNLLRRGGL